MLLVIILSCTQAFIDTDNQYHETENLLHEASQMRLDIQLGSSNASYVRLKQLFESAVELGSTEAMFYLGELLLLADAGGYPDLQAAYELFSKAAQLAPSPVTAYSHVMDGEHEMSQGPSVAADAHFYLGFLAATGLHNGQWDHKEAIKHFEASGSTQARMALGYRFLHGLDGLPRNCEAAVEQYFWVASQVITDIEHEGVLAELDDFRLSNDSESLGGSFLQGLVGDAWGGSGGGGGAGGSALGAGSGPGGWAVEDEGMHFYRERAMNNDPVAAQLVGDAHFFGLYGAAFNRSEALRFYKIGADGKDARSMTQLGKMYLDGSVVDQDNHTAFTYLSEAASLGDVSAINAVGLLHLYGTGTKVNTTRALELFQEAAASGDVQALFNIGALHFLAMGGVEQNYSAAFDYFTRASQVKGEQMRTPPKSRGKDQDNKGPHVWEFERAEDVEEDFDPVYMHEAGSSHTRALFNLGQLYYHGLGTGQPPNCERAARLYAEVAERSSMVSTLLTEGHTAIMRGEVGRAIMLFGIAAEIGYASGGANSGWLLDQTALRILKETKGLMYSTFQEEATKVQESAAKAGESNDKNNGLKGYWSITHRHRLAVRHLAMAAGSWDGEALRQLGDLAYYGHKAGPEFNTSWNVHFVIPRKDPESPQPRFKPDFNTFLRSFGVDPREHEEAVRVRALHRSLHQVPSLSLGNYEHYEVLFPTHGPPSDIVVVVQGVCTTEQYPVTAFFHYHLAAAAAVSGSWSGRAPKLDPQALFNLGFMYYQGALGLPNSQDMNLSIQYYKYAARIGPEGAPAAYLAMLLTMVTTIPGVQGGVNAVLQSQMHFGAGVLVGLFTIVYCYYKLH